MGELMIVIPSLGRVNSHTAKMLDASKTHFELLVEPHEAEAYELRWGAMRVQVLPSSGAGLASTRNHVLGLLRAGVYGESVWMLDDDVRWLGIVSDRKVVRADAGSVLAQAQAIFELHRVAIGALEYQQFAWSAKNPIRVSGGYCDVCVWLHADRARGLEYDPAVTLKEDRDLVLQALSMRKVVARSTHTAFSAPANGSNEGGLHALYQQSGAELAAVDGMVAKWPGVVTRVTKSSGRVDAKIDWRAAVVRG